MTSNLLRSNSLPYGKEDGVLRELLSQQGDELANLDQRIESKEWGINQLKSSIKQLKISLEAATDALKIYEQHKDQLATIHQALSTRFSATLVTVNDDFTFAPFLENDLTQRIETCRTEDQAVEESCEKLRLSISSMNEESRCQTHQLAVSEMSLQVSRSTRDEIRGIVGELKEKFRSIKRVPDEIWLEILEIVVKELNDIVASNSGDTTTISVALPFSQVCRAWRRVMLCSPGIWTTIHCCAAAGKQLSGRRRLVPLLLEKAKSRPLTFVDKRRYRSQTNAGCWWWWPASLDSSIESNMDQRFRVEIGRCTYHTLLSNTHPHSGPDSLPSTQPQSLVFEVAAPGWVNRLLSEKMLQNIKTGSLTLINFAIKAPQSLLSDGLTELKIFFNSPYPAGATGSPQPYTLSSLLGEGLQSLHLAHYDSDMFTWTGDSMRLPRLKTLFITPNEHHLLDKLDLPALESLTVSKSLGPSDIPVESWLPKMATLCKNVTSLTLDGLEPMLPVLLALYPHILNLQALTISHCTFEGPKLCRHLEKLVEKTLSRLPCLSFESCVGLSQVDCERLNKIIEKLNVFRSESI